MIACLLLGAITYANQAALDDGVALDGLGALALIVLAAAGPFPALVLLLVGDILQRIRAGSRHRGLAVAGNVASYMWGLLAATATLAALGRPAAHDTATVSEGAALLVAGAVYLTVNYAVTRGVAAVIADRQRPLQLLRREFIPMVPAQIAVVAIGALVATLSARFGPLGLLPLVLAVIAPQSMLSLLARMQRPANEMSLFEARRTYALALADALSLPAAPTRVVELFASLPQDDEDEPESDSPDAQLRMPTVRGEDDDFSCIRTPLPPWRPLPSSALGRRRAARFARLDLALLAPVALAIRERFDGLGWPGASAGETIPIEARIVHIADLWARATCHEGFALSQAAALEQLELASGRELDPHLVTIAQEIIATEPRLGRSPSAAPALHRLPRPRLLPRRQLARLVQAVR